MWIWPRPPGTSPSTLGHHWSAVFRAKMLWGWHFKGMGKHLQWECKPGSTYDQINSGLLDIYHTMNKHTLLISYSWRNVHIFVCFIMVLNLMHCGDTIRRCKLCETANQTWLKHAPFTSTISLAVNLQRKATGITFSPWSPCWLMLCTLDVHNIETQNV